MSTDHSNENSAASESGKEGSFLKNATEIAMERAKQNPSGETPSVSSLSSKELDELREKAGKAQENWDKLLRTQADLENYRKRAARERQDLIKTANEKLLLEILAPIDHFEMGLQSIPKGNEDNPVLQGMEMILNQFKQFLNSQGVTEIESVGQAFDPSLHEALAQQESDQPEGQVIQQVRKGYRLKDKLLRTASVIVSKGKQSAVEKKASDSPIDAIPK